VVSARRAGALLDPRLPIIATIVWMAGAALSAAVGLWVGLGGTAITLGIVVLSREWVFFRDLLKPRSVQVLIGLLAGLVLALTTHLVYAPIAQRIPFMARDTAHLYAKLGASSHLWLSLALAPVIIGEELVWRGLVQGAIGHRLGSFSGVLLAASLYALAQVPVGSPVLAFVALVCGIIWGALRACTNGLVAPMLAHLLWDFLILFMWPIAAI
jgi:uncharacterized protein